jgi:hypothetical protein
MHASGSTFNAVYQACEVAGVDGNQKYQLLLRQLIISGDKSRLHAILSGMRKAVVFYHFQSFFGSNAACLSVPRLF